MRQARLALGVASGLVLALVFVAGANALGPAAQHIDLLPAASSSVTPPQGAVLTGQAVTTGNLAPSPSPSQSPSLSSVGALTTDGSGAVALLTVPILIAAAGGFSLYLLVVRRVDAE